MTVLPLVGAGLADPFVCRSRKLSKPSTRIARLTRSNSSYKRWKSAPRTRLASTEPRRAHQTSRATSWTRGWSMIGRLREGKEGVGRRRGILVLRGGRGRVAVGWARSFRSANLRRSTFPRRLRRTPSPREGRPYPPPPLLPARFHRQRPPPTTAVNPATPTPPSSPPPPHHPPDPSPAAPPHPPNQATSSPTRSTPIVRRLPLPPTIACYTTNRRRMSIWTKCTIVDCIHCPSLGGPVRARVWEVAVRVGQRMGPGRGRAC